MAAPDQPRKQRFVVVNGTKRAAEARLLAILASRRSFSNLKSGPCPACGAQPRHNPNPPSIAERPRLSEWLHDGAALFAHNGVERPAGSVYLFGGDQVLKIGWSANVGGRLRDFNQANPFNLTLLGSFPGTTDDEASLLAYFIAHRIRGEWFYDHKEIRAFFARICKEYHPAERKGATPQQASEESKPELSTVEALRARLRKLADDDLTLSSNAVAKLLGMSVSAVKRALVKGEIPSVEVGRKRRVELEALVKLVS